MESKDRGHGTVLLQFGQGGIQFGSAFLDALRRHATTTAPPADFFREEQPLGCRSSTCSSVVARAILVDSEPKVAAAALSCRRSPAWRYASHNGLTFQHSGSANNWSWGFCKNGPKCQEVVMDSVRREVERCDIFSGFVSVHSLAGGTGGGVGAFIMEILREEYPSSFMLGCCLWPLAGEVSVQSYNVLLSIAHLQQVADGLVSISNEALMGACKKMVGIQRPSFHDMNDVGTRGLASVLLPAYPRSCSTAATNQRKGSVNWKQPPPVHRRGSTLSNILSALCMHPHYRMLALRATPQMPAGLLKQTTYSWRSHLKQLKRMMYMEHPNLDNYNNSSNGCYKSMSMHMDRCVANLIVLRGNHVAEADVSLMEDRALYPIWSVDPLSVATHPAHLGDYDMFVGLLSNCQSAIAPASHLLSRARAMYSSKAFLHHYFRHGLEPDDFQEAFTTVEEILACYHAL